VSLRKIKGEESESVVGVVDIEEVVKERQVSIKAGL